MEDKKLLVIRASNAEKGIKLFFQSEFFEDFFKASHNQSYQKDDYHNVRLWGKDKYGYIPPNDRVFNSFKNWGGRLYEKGRPNLSFLTAVGLAKGVEFVLPSFIMNEGILDKYITDLKKELAKVYKEYFTSISFEENFCLDD